MLYRYEDAIGETSDFVLGICRMGLVRVAAVLRSRQRGRLESGSRHLRSTCDRTSDFIVRASCISTFFEESLVLLLCVDKSIFEEVGIYDASATDFEHY